MDSKQERKDPRDGTTWHLQPGWDKAQFRTASAGHFFPANVPARTNRRFYPHDKNISNMIQRTLLSVMYVHVVISLVMYNCVLCWMIRPCPTFSSTFSDIISTISTYITGLMKMIRKISWSWVSGGRMITSFTIRKRVKTTGYSLFISLLTQLGCYRDMEMSWPT